MIFSNAVCYTKLMAPAGNSGKKILIVEDDPFIIKAYTLKLGKEGFTVNYVSDGLAAIESLKKGEFPDLILLDLMLPKMNGFDILKEISQNHQWKNIPVLILSNLNSEEDVAKGKKLGASDYIAKADTSIDDVIAKIKKYL